jgi:hypothetical protein
MRTELERTYWELLRADCSKEFQVYIDLKRIKKSSRAALPSCARKTGRYFPVAVVDYCETVTECEVMGCRITLRKPFKVQVRTMGCEYAWVKLYNGWEFARVIQRESEQVLCRAEDGSQFFVSISCCILVRDEKILADLPSPTKSQDKPSAKHKKIPCHYYAGGKDIQRGGVAAGESKAGATPREFNQWVALTQL